MQGFELPVSFAVFTWLSATVGVLAFLVALLHFTLEPLRWKTSYLPVHSDSEAIASVRDALYCTALATYLLPFKLGIPLRVALLRSRAKLDLHFIGVVIALDGLISLFAWSVLTAASIWIAALHWHPPAFVWWLGVAGMIVLGMIVVVQPRLRGRWLHRWRDALALLDRPWHRVAVATGILAGDVVGYGVRHALLVFLLTGEVRLMLVGGATGVVATFAGIVSGLPMGLVGYDATLIALLTTTGVPMSQSVWIALINRGLNLVSAAVLGLPAAFRLRLGSGVSSILHKLWNLAHDRE